MRIDANFTEEEIAVIVMAIDYYAYNGPHITDEKFDLLISAQCKILEGD